MKTDMFINMAYYILYIFYSLKYNIIFFCNNHQVDLSKMESVEGFRKEQ